MVKLSAYMKTKTLLAWVFWATVVGNVLWILMAWDMSELSELDKKLLMIRKSISYATVFLAYIAWRVTP